jgi:Restriction endonuclease
MMPNWITLTPEVELFQKVQLLVTAEASSPAPEMEATPSKKNPRSDRAGQPENRSDLTLRYHAQMTSNAQYQAKIQTYDWDNLLALWQAVQTGDTPGWESGRALEYLIVRAFELDGAEVTYPFTVQSGGTPIEQIDGAIFLSSLTCLIECKAQDSNIAIDPIAKLRNQLSRRPAGIIGAVFATKSFTDATIILAQYNASQAILLWNGDDIAYALTNRVMSRGLLKKYRYCAERGRPDYNLNVGDIL